MLLPCRMSAQDSTRLHLKKPFARALIVPTLLVTYGALSLKSGSLKDLNVHVNKRVYLEGQSAHIDNYLQYAPAVMVYGLNLAGIKGKNNFIDRTVIYGLSNAIMGIVVNTTKHYTKEWRPDGSNQLSFPSGHTATAFAAAEFLRQEYKDVSPWYGIAGYAMAASTGYLRMYNNRHWLGDVIAGAGVGILSTDVAYYIYPSIKKVFKKNQTVLLPTYQQGALGLCLVHRW